MCMIKILLYDNIPEYLLSSATIRYLSTSGKYVIRGYCHSLSGIAEMKLTEFQLLALISKDAEAIKIADIDDDTKQDFEIINYVFKISATTLKQARQQWHRQKLGRSDFTILNLSPRIHTKKIKVPSQNIENYEAIYEKCLKTDNYIGFMDLNREWCRYKGIKFIASEWKEKYRTRTLYR